MEKFPRANSQICFIGSVDDYILERAKLTTATKISAALYRFSMIDYDAD